MKKIFTIIALSITLFSCKKDVTMLRAQKCYHCTFGKNGGYTPAPVDYCGDDNGARKFKDDAGNDLTVWCKEK